MSGQTGLHSLFIISLRQNYVKIEYFFGIFKFYRVYEVINVWELEWHLHIKASIEKTIDY